MVTAIRSRSSQWVTPPMATTRAVAQAGGWGHESLTKSRQQTARASGGPQNRGQPGSCSDTGLPDRWHMRRQTMMPTARQVQCPRITERGAAESERGAVNRMKVDGPRAGKMKGRSVSQASKLRVKMARPPLTEAAKETAFFSSKRASKEGVDRRARQMR